MAMLLDGQKCGDVIGRTEMWLWHWMDRNVAMLLDGQKCGSFSGRTEMWLC